MITAGSLHASMARALHLLSSHMRHTRLLSLLLSVCMSLITLSGQAQAQDNWPEHAIKFIVPYTPGGGTDVVSRNLTDKMARETKWTFVIENKPGVGGNIGLDQIAKAKPDGYTIGMGQTSNLAINPAIMPAMPFQAAKDFSPIALIAQVPMLLVVSAQSEFTSLADLLNKARTTPTELRQAVAALGTVGHLAGELLAQQAKYKVLIVPYKGASPALTDLIGGQTDFMMATPQGILPLIQSGKLRALAVTSAKRLTMFPAIPTIAESGFPGFEAVDWKVVVGPAGMAEETIQRFNLSINQALKNPVLLQQLEAEGSSAMGGTAEYARDYIASGQRQWAQLIQESGLKF